MCGSSVQILLADPVVHFKGLQPCHTLIFVSEILYVFVLCYAHQIPLHNQLEKVAASWNSDILQSLRVLPFYIIEVPD
jgi:hypothetical protein